MADHLWSADGAGGKEEPFGRLSIKMWIGRRQDHRPTRDLQRKTNQGTKIRIGIDDRGIDLCGGDNRSHLRGWHIGRKKYQATRDAVEFDQRQRGRQLVAGRDENKSVMQTGSPADEAGAICQRAELDGRFTGPEMSLAGVTLSFQ